jgi:SAM-dependent methyltransferase
VKMRAGAIVGKARAIFLRLFQFNLARALIRREVRRAAPSINGRVLDVGAGECPYEAFFRNCQYIALNARPFFGPSVPESIARRTDVWSDGGEQLPFTDAEFDAVLCFQVLSVIAQPAELLREISRVTRVGGKVLLSTDFLYPTWAENDRQRFTAFGLRELAERAGLTVDTIVGCGGLTASVYAAVTRAVRDGSRRLRGESSIVLLTGCLVHVILFAITPVLTVLGWALLLRERHGRIDAGFSPMLFLVAHKRLPGEGGLDA